jgi:hypothetical protein
MKKRKVTMSIHSETFIALNVHAATRDIKLSDLAQEIFQEFVENSIKGDKTSVS